MNSPKFILYAVVFSLFFSINKLSAQVVFTALPGNAPSYLAKGATNQVVFGFSVFVPANATFSPGPVHIATSTNLNGFVSGNLIRTSSANPALAVSNPLNSYGANINGTIDINGFPNLNGGTGGSTYYFYLVLSITNTANQQPASVVFSLPTSNISQNGYNGSNNNITVNNSANASPTYFFTPVTPTQPTASAVSRCGAGSVTLTASGGSPSGGTYNWYASATGSTALQSSTSASFTTNIVTTTTYYVSYTAGGVESARTAVTATDNPIVSSPISGAIFSYPFNGNANDISGNANNGYTTASPTLVADRYGAANSAYSFNGSNQFLTVNGSGAATTGINVFTVSIWFNTTTTSGGKLIGFGGSNAGLSGTYDRHLYMANNGQLYWGIYPGSVQTINTTASYNDGKWHHAIVTMGPDGSTLYVDGVTSASAKSASMTTGQGFTGYWRIGGDNLGGWTASPTSNYFSGTLDDIAIYNRELSSAEITSSNDINQIGFSPSLVCAGSPISFNSPLITGATYTWTDSGGNTVTGQNPTFSSAVAGNYTLTVTGGAGGCSSSATITPNISSPSASFTVPATANIGSNTTITYTGTDPSSSSYSWNFGGGTIISGSGQGPYSVAWATTGTKTISLTVTNANGCSATTTQTINVVNTNSYGSYSYKRIITLNTTSAGITSNLSNFPVLLSIQSNDLIISGTCGDKVQIPNGPNYDFAFVDPNSASELNYQIESYNQATGTLLVWVRVPTITYAVNNTIAFYYGSTAPVVTHNITFFQNTWTSDYQSVYHFNEAAYTGTTQDGTANGRTGTLVGFQSSDLQPGKIGTAYAFGGASGSASANDMEAAASPVSTAFTLSAWVNSSNVNLDEKILTNQNSSGLSSTGYKLGIYFTIPETEGGGNLNRSTLPNPTPLVNGTWYYVQGVYDGASLSTYVNGLQYKKQASTANVNLTNTLYIGIGEGKNYPFSGLIDEPRVSNVAKTGDWIKMEYVDQNNPVAFTNVSSTAVINSTYAATIKGELTYNWTGAAGTDPSNAGNWSNTSSGVNGILPAFDGSATFVIPAGLANYPSLTANTSLYGLNIASGASLNLNGFTLSVGCNIYNNATTGGTGILNGGNGPNGGVNWNGSLATQYYYGYNNVVNTAEINNMTINNSAGGTIKLTYGPTDVYAQLTLTSGNLVVDNGTGGTGATLTLKSSSALTANVNAIPAACSISGNVNVERYISGGSNAYRGYRLFSSPVYTATSGSAHYYDLSYIANYMPTTGSLGPSGGMTKYGNPTIYLYRDNVTSTNKTFNTGNFRGVCKINSSPLYLIGVDYDGMSFKLHPGTGFMAWYRGNLTNIANKFSTGTIAEANVFMSTGVLNQQAITVYNWYTDQPVLQYTAPGTTGNAASYAGYNLVGNPYPSSIDWSKFSNSNPSAAIYGPNVGPTIWEFNVINKGYGTYSNGLSVNTGNNIIASGQGFFVQTQNTGTPSLTFTENAKSNVQLTGPTTSSGSSVLLMSTRPVAQQQLQYARFELSLDTINKEEAIVRFDNTASNAYNINEDAQYFTGSNAVKLSTRSADGIYLAINDVPFPKTIGQIVKMTTNAAADGLYTLKMTELKSIPQLYEIWLKDAYRNDSLDIRHNPVYQFNIVHSDTSSFGDNRFSLVIRQNPALGVHLLNFSAAKAAAGAEIDWKTENEANYTNFTVERSTDNGKTFTVVGGFLSAGQGNYSLMDSSPSPVEDQYRLKLEDLNGNITYSKIVTLMYSNLTDNKTTSNVFVYPNPATNVINVNISQGSVENGQSGSPSYNIQLTSSTGKVLKTVSINQSSWQDNVSGLLPGTYIIDVFNNNDKSVVGKAKFVKL